MRVLHYYPLCPFSRKVRLCLAEKKLDFAQELTNFWEKKPEFTSLNPLGYVPVLIDLNGSILADSTAIAEYLEEAYPDRKLYPDDLLGRAEARRLMGWFDTRFAQEVSLVILWEKVIKRMINQNSGNSNPGPDSGLIRHTKNTLTNHMEYIAWLVDRRNWLAGDHFSVADITAAAHLSVVDYFGDINWEKFETVKSWFMRIKSRPSYRGFFNDRVPAIAPAPHYAELDF
jgi:glutathione S-transferase